MTPDPAIVALAERHVVAAGMKGRRLARFVDDDFTWTVNLDTETARVGRHAFGLDIVGTASYEEGTWLWAWANPSIDERHTASARMLRELGEARGLPRFTDERSMPLTTMDAELAGIIATGEARAPGCMAGALDDGTSTIVLLLHGPELAAEPYEGMDLAGTLGEIAVEAALGGRGAVRGFAEALEPGFSVVSEADREIVFGAPDGTVRVRFDEHDRITEVRGDLGPAR